MASRTIDAKIEQELHRLEAKVEELVTVCHSLREENRLLRKRQSEYSIERASHIERNQEARMRVEAMINRLKSLEQT